MLQTVRGTAEVEAELAEIRKAAGEARAGSGGMALFTRRRHLPQLLWCIAMPVMQQYTGINAFMFYGGPSVTALTDYLQRALVFNIANWEPFPQRHFMRPLYGWLFQNLSFGVSGCVMRLTAFAPVQPHKFSSYSGWARRRLCWESSL